MSGNLLGAASILVAVLTHFATQVLSATAAVLDKPVPRFSDDRGPLLAETRAVLTGRLIPLAVAGCAVGLALLPPAWDVVAGAARAIGGSWSYDAVRACFLLVEFFLVALTGVVVVRLAAVAGRLRALRVERHPATTAPRQPR